MCKIVVLRLFLTRFSTDTPSSRVTIVVALQKYYKGLYGDLSDRYSGVRNNTINTSEILIFSPCLNLWCFLSIFGSSWAIPASFSSAVVRYIYNSMQLIIFLLRSLASLRYLWVLFTTYCFGRDCHSVRYIRYISIRS